MSEANVKQPKVAAGGTSAAKLAAGCAALGIALPAGAQEKLLAYIALLAKWNRTYNLTAVRDPNDMVSHHLLDSLAVLPHLAPDTALADVGSGAGLPGLVLAVASPSLRLVSIEANQKKIAFQQQAKIELKLTNVDVKCRRVEAVAPATFDAAISRAFADLADFVRLAGHLIKPGGRLLAMKGTRSDAELAALPAPWRATAVHKLEIPGLAAQRHLIVLEKTGGPQPPDPRPTDGFAQPSGLGGAEQCSAKPRPRPEEGGDGCSRAAPAQKNGCSSSGAAQRRN